MHPKCAPITPIEYAPLNGHARFFARSSNPPRTRFRRRQIAIAEINDRSIQRQNAASDARRTVVVELFSSNHYGVHLGGGRYDSVMVAAEKFEVTCAMILGSV